MTEPAAAQPQDRIAEILSGPVARPGVSVFYRLGLLLVALVVVLLPLVYVALIGAAGWAVYGHATENTGILTGGSGRGIGRAAVGRLLLYLAPLVVGGILVLFMIKPLFARPAKRGRTISAGPDRQPLLSDLVRRLAAAAGAPAPRRIEFDCEVNASASFRRGVLSFFGRDLLLTIGLPLVEGLTLRQFVGVLAHELGHFAQGTGMRVSFIIRSVNFWFARVVYERDTWDEWLVKAATEIDIRIGIVFHLARFFVWLTRRVLWVLMMVGHAVSTFFLRQMEYDADQVEIQIAGSRTFEETARMLPVLTIARQKALNDLEEAWAERRLGDDLPRLVQEELKRLPEEPLKAWLKEHFAEGSGSMFDTHPPDLKRIEAARVEGVFDVEGPASALFCDFPGVSRAASLAFYPEALGAQVSEKNPVSTAAVLSKQDEQEADAKRLSRYFQGYRDPDLSPFLPEDAMAPPEDAAAALAELKQVLEAALAMLPEARTHARAKEQAGQRLATLAQADLLLRVNLKTNPGDFRLKAGATAEVTAERKRAAQQRDEVGTRRAEIKELMRRRLVLALGLRQTPAVA